MKRIAIYSLILTLFTPTLAFASLGGKEDYSEERVVAISLDSKIGSTPWANGSGYLYSPRIVFSAGHLKDHNPSGIYYVSQPNQKLIEGMPTVKVVKTFFPSTYTPKIYSDDFAVFVLEKPLKDIPKANLITQELFSQFVATKSPMKILGFGAFEDVCELEKKSSPCAFGSERTSVVPRSIEMIPSTALDIDTKFHQSDTRIADHLFFTGPYKSCPCGGDSGGPTIARINGLDYYVGTVPTGFWNAYACGQSPGYEGETIGWTAPVYKFLDLISEAETYVKENPYIPTEPVSTLKNNELPDLEKLAKMWALTSRSIDSGKLQCASARDKGLIFKNGKLVSLGKNSAQIRESLKSASGFKACLNGFKK